MVAQQVAGGEDEVVEIQQRRRALVPPEARHDRLDQGNEIGEHMGSDGPLQLCPRRATMSVVGAGLVVQAIAVGLSQTYSLRRRSPLRLFLVLPEAARLSEQLGATWRGQNPDKPSGCLGSGTVSDFVNQFPEASRDGDSLGLLGLFTGQEIVEGLRCFPERGRALLQILPLVGGEGAMAAEMAEDGADQRQGRVGIVQDQLGEQAAGLAGELLPQPGVDKLVEDEVRLVAVHHAGTGVDVGFHWIGRDEALAEAVNGRARHLVERRICRCETAALLVREAVRQRDAKLGRNLAGRKRAHEGPHPDQQLARGELGEGHGGDVLWARHLRASSMAIRPAMTAVLPEPAPASTRNAAVVDRNDVPPGRHRPRVFFRRAAITRRPRPARHPPGVPWPQAPCAGGKWRRR